MVKNSFIQFYYSVFNPIDMSSFVWAFMHPAPPTADADLDIPNSQSSSFNIFCGSSNQQTKDPCSPILKNTESMTSLESCLKPKMKLENNKKIKQKSQEEEFKPNAPELKKSRKTPQNANRNVVPNIMHQVISFLQKKNKSQKLVEKLIQNLKIENVCSVKRFYFYQLLIKEKLNHYVNADSLIILKELQEPLCEVYSEQEQRHYNKISRLLIQYFLSRDFDTIILTSKRVSSGKKLDHLKMKRKILQQISEMFSN